MATSLVLHAAAVVALVFVRGDAPAPPQERIYAVDIVSPPPNVAGERPTEALAPQEPAPAEPEPEPAEPEPVPEPEPPREEPTAEPPPRPTPPRERPKTERPAERPSTTPAQGSGTTARPATGATPQPSSPGGEGVRVYSPGDPCPVAGYCENVVLTVRRFFRPPAGSASATGEICFRIQRDGSVAGMRVQGMRGGSAAFRVAMLEAAEAAGRRRAFGALPAAFDPERWNWCVELSPS